jgi:hypothetical protein
VICIITLEEQLESTTQESSNSSMIMVVFEIAHAMRTASFLEGPSEDNIEKFTNFIFRLYRKNFIIFLWLLKKPVNKKPPFGPGVNFGPDAFGKHGNAWIGGSKATFNKQRPERAAARGR